MKCIKRMLAAVMAGVLMMPIQLVRADNTLLQTAAEESVMKETITEDIEAESSDIEDRLQKEASATENEETSETEEERKKITEKITSVVSKKIQDIAKAEKEELTDNYAVATANNLVKVTGDEVKFNTGNHVWSVVSYEDFQENEAGDVYFEEDGSYTINIPEENPFFPYEVQFTYKGKTQNKWFMTPDDSVEVGGHIFYVSAFFDDTAVTQMSLEVAGDTVVVYPEKKKFTNDGDGTAQLSLLPLEERRLTVDLRGYTPVELTMVSIADLFNGQIQSTDKVVWRYENENNYEIGLSEGTIDLSRDAYRKNVVEWEIIVGDDDQLASDNIRYLLTINVTKCNNWLIPTVYTQDSKGNRKPVPIIKSEYIGYMNPYLYIYTAEVDYLSWAGLKINPSVFDKSHYDHLKVYDSNVWSLERAILLEQEGTISQYDLTDKVFSKDMTEIDAGIPIYSTVSLIAYDGEGKIIGFQVLDLVNTIEESGIQPYGLYIKTGDERIPLNLLDWIDEGGDWPYYGWTYEKNPEDEAYVVFSYRENGISKDVSNVTAAYAGKYLSIEEAKAAGAEDIKDVLFDQSDYGGYKANFSNGICFSVFVGNDNSEKQESYFHIIWTEKKSIDENRLLTFTGLKDRSGNNINCYIVNDEEDYYAEYSYLTILAEEGTDLTCLAPVFQSQNNKTVYTSGSNSPEKSGESYHDFSNGAIQYIVSDKNETGSKNRWLQVITPVNGRGKLYINSLAAEEAGTAMGADGEVLSVREMIMYEYPYEHDILLMNIGTESITDLKAEVKSEQVELDPYWTLNGNYELSGASTVVRKDGNEYGQLPNMAKLRLKRKNDVKESEEISGTLTVRSGNKVLMVLTLTGMIGSPEITDWEIKDGVKYVPYGTMISNNNKYSWNTVTYYLTSGRLPKGMTLESNGELYGVPLEIGEFRFTVCMENSYSVFGSSEGEFTLTITENTDSNVDASTDTGYELTRRVPDITLNSTEDQMMISQGDYDEFVHVFLDGEKLVRGTDYISEAGSTRITIRSQTLKRSNTPGVHTLGIEFRTKGTKILKRAAQNFRITSADDTGDSGNNSGNGNGSGNYSGSNGSSESSDNNLSQIYRDPKKGYVHRITGIITGEKAGYSHWQQDESGWKLLYADKTTASGYMTVLQNGENVEQVIWEKINGSWYAFGADGYLKSGWVYDYGLGNWYSLSADTGMLIGWYTDPVDNHTYYLDPAEGGVSTGWRNIEEAWYYFNTIVTEPSWELNKETNKWQYNAKSKAKPLGAMLRDERTPDGYNVKADGVWDGKEKQ